MRGSAATVGDSLILWVEACDPCLRIPYMAEGQADKALSLSAVHPQRNLSLGKLGIRYRAAPVCCS